MKMHPYMYLSMCMKMHTTQEAACPETNNTAACEQTFPGEWILGRVDGKDPPRMCKVGHTYAEPSELHTMAFARMTYLPTTKEIAHRGEGGE